MEIPSLVSFFTDSIYRAPTIGCMLMCLAASLIGVVVFLRKQSLIGEALSHAAYPGIILGVIIAGTLSMGEGDEFGFSLLVLSCAFLTAVTGFWAIQALIKHVHVPADAALCFILSTFFGIGLTLTSEVQFSFTILYRQAITYLYGQAATMTDIHIAIYGVFACVTLVAIIIFYKELQAIIFDRNFAKSLGIRVNWIEGMIFFLATAAIIIGIRSVGVILMSAMLIAPAVAARQFTHRLSILFLLAALFGVASGFFGNYFSVLFTVILSKAYPTARIILPTGPMIVLTATAICVIALLFAPERGLFVRIWRIGLFRYTCLCENILKTLWTHGPEAIRTIDQIADEITVFRPYLKWLLGRMVKNGWLKKIDARSYHLTMDGRERGAKIVRLHRLWEVYLANYLDVGVEKVHRNAEEMEHILTPELEEELISLLNDPKQDPHQQPIPSRGGLHAL